jgi:GNAT superfamily N-acetyltransferase
MNSKQPDLMFEAIKKSDIPALTAMMTRTFDDDAQKYLKQEKGGPPGYDTGEFFEKWLLGFDESQGYKMMVGDQIVGSFIVWIFESGENILGSIFVDPDSQDQGIGTRTWQYIERMYPETKSWTLETPIWATKNHFFYEQKCGFQRIGKREDEYIYKKEMRSTQD